MSIKSYIDNKFRLNKLSEVSFYKGKRKDKSKIYLIKEGKEYEIESEIITKGVNEKGEGVILVINQSEAIYLEQQNYFKGLNDFLDSIKDFCETIATKPIVITPQGPANGTPELIGQAKILSSKADILKREIP